MNYLHRWIIVGIISVGICGTSWAATVVERRDTQGNKQKLTMNEQQARLESPKTLNFYTLINLEEEKVYLVNDKKKRIVKMDIIGKPPKPPKNMPLPRNMPKPPWGKFMRAQLIQKGKGPIIAGYFTKRYEIRAYGKAQGNKWDKVCSDNYFSKRAFEIVGFKKFLEAMYQMSNSRKPNIKGMPIHPCQQAHDELEIESRKFGIPMKSVIKGNNRNDKVRHEIVNIKTDVKVSTDFFVLPEHYKMITEQEMIKEQQAAMKKWREESRQRDDYRQMPQRGYGQPDDRRDMPPPGRYEQPNDYRYPPR
ncbi:hypothetical protein [Candidatus Parabeggiatoa sp. HSG14]|uniref:hypothetical protein n=1 Tax=Candidatus Parabeggiatoa sp. HSG14 TaxID=3055593 RepID=UPI0025A78674|nr:hypothetical protein [Thiotrichales bacterium HSG14]